MRTMGAMKIFMAVGLLALTGTTVASTPTTGVAVYEQATAAFSEAGVQDLCTVECTQGYDAGCGDKCKHVAPEVEPGTHEVGGGAHSHCWEGYCELASGECEAKHDLCEPTQNEQLEELTQLLAAGDLVAVSLRMESDEFIELDPQEGLLAVHQCSGRVSGTIALTGPELQALSFALVE